MLRVMKGTLAIVLTSLMCACQNPTEPTDLDYMEVTASPSTTTATPSTGRTYKIVGTDSRPDQIIEYPWKTSFGVTLRLTEDAEHEDGSLDLPVDVTAATAVVKQAAGGIVVAPPSGTIEYYEAVPSASGNRFTRVGETITLNFDVYYDLPNKGKEALITVSFSFADEDGVTFSDSVQVRVAP